MLWFLVIKPRRLKCAVLVEPVSLLTILAKDKHSRLILSKLKDEEKKLNNIRPRSNDYVDNNEGQVRLRLQDFQHNDI